VVFALVSSVVFVGCGASDSPAEDPSVLIQQSLYNWGEVSSFRYKLGADADMNVEASGGKIAFEIDFSGAVSQKDPEKPGFELSTVAKLKDPNKKEYKFDLAVKNVSSNFYIKLLDLPEIPDFQTDALKDFVGPWWKIDSTQLGEVPETFSGLIGKPSAALDEKEKQVRELIKTASFFKDIEYKGTESVNGYDCYVYSVSENDDGLMNYISKAVEIQGQDASAVDVDGFKEFLAMSSFEGEIYLDLASTTFVRIVGDLIFTDPQTNDSGTLSVDLNFSDLNQPFSVEAPTDFKDFDIASFFGAFLQSSIK